MKRWLIVVALCLSTLAVFWPVTRFDFVPYDDPDYVSGNPVVLAGVSPGGAAWAFTSFAAANWHPLTWLSHMADVELFGPAPGRHHLVSLLIHTAAAAALFLVLGRYTGALWPSALVAALFAVHPLHVESAAWVAERKDVLSGLLAVLTLGAYLSYARRPSRPRYAGVVALFAAGLMAKPMLVTLPCVLLLLDWWPLGRTASAGSRAPAQAPAAFARAAALLREKLPLFALAAASAAVTWAAQSRGRAVLTPEALPFDVRAQHALVSWGAYLVKAAWPVDLAVFYPHPMASPPLWQVTLAAAFLACISAVVIALRRTHPHLAFGWCWYLGTLVPVIGLVQVGHQSLADRYTYLPLIGVFVALAWGASRLPLPWPVLPAAAGVLLASLMILCREQVGVWRDGETLFSHALARTRDNWLAHTNLGTIRYQQGREDEAIDHYREALRIKPDYPIAQFDLANALADRGEFDAAASHYEMALELDPTFPGASVNYGNALARQGNLERAVVLYRRVLETKPASFEGHLNLGLALLRLGRGADAQGHLEEALRLGPVDADTRTNLGLLLADSGRFEQAEEHLAAAVALDPSNGYARFALERVRRVRRDGAAGASAGVADGSGGGPYRR